MPVRQWRGPFGLRGRIVGAVLVTTVATLGVAAVALLGPLQRQLRNSELKTLSTEVRDAAPTFNRLRPEDLGLDGGTTRADFSKPLERAVADLQKRTGGDVSLLGYPLTLLASTPVQGGTGDDFADVVRAFQTGAPVGSFGSSDGQQVAKLARPILIGAQGGRPAASGRNSLHTYVLAIRKPIPEVAGAVAVVRRAFITAALAGLALTLILGIPLAARLVRRLRNLSQTALRLAAGGPTVEVPVDRVHDEVGDLARTLVTMQRQLQHQEEARRAFVATASHELRTPLTSLDGMLELLDEDLGDEHLDLDDARALLRRARAQSRRLGRLAADLLDLSRLDAAVDLRSEPVELGELSRAVIAEFELGTAERGIQSTLDGSPGALWALGDPGSVARILRILLDNAVRMSPEGAEIWVELNRGDAVSISVRDEGPGVPEGEREHIFKRFHRGRETGGKAGFGLGLAIGRELAERMGGELVLEDTAGIGARFTLRLPAAQAPEHEPLAVA
jgi:signal transduction histidine kinase